MKEDFAALAKKEYDELIKQKTDLQAQIAEIDGKIKPLESYLKATGIIKEPEKSKRGRKPKDKPA